MPLIGLTCYVEPIRHGAWDEDAAFTPSTYVESISRAGGTPVLLPPAADASAFDVLDGLVVIGGPDVGPSLYGAPPHAETDTPRVGRDHWELRLIAAALDVDLPLLCICRGHQLLNVALGGSLHQHLDDVVGHGGHRTEVGAMAPNTVAVVAGTRLASILPPVATTLCHHHQAIDRLAPSLAVAATTADGVIEAVEVEDRTWALGVQWHPEEDPSDTRLFDAFVAAARKRPNPG